MTQVAPEVISSGTENPRRKLFATGFLAIGFSSLVSLVARYNESLFLLCFSGSLIYVIYLLRRTWQVVRGSPALSHFDRRVLRWAGPIAILPGSLLLGASAMLEHRGIDIDRYVSGTDWGWFLFQCQAEVGLVLSWATLVAPRSHPFASRPWWLWKLTSAPFFLLYLVHMIGALCAGFGQSLAPKG